jgi:uncharacterized protein YlxW (UPF0749 family)
MFESWILLVDKVHPQDMQAIMAVLTLAVMFLVVFLVLCSMLVSRAETKAQRNLESFQEYNAQLIAQVEDMRNLVMVSNGVVNATQNALEERTKGVTHGN